MAKHLVFFQGGGGEEDFKADAKLVDSLKSHLGSAYKIYYPFLPDDGTADSGRRKQITHQIIASDDNVILVAHSLGASMLLACLSETKPAKKIAGIFLIATPFWSGDEDWVQPYKLKPNFANQLDKDIPLFLYHCRDDQEVPFDHFDIYKKELPWASFKEIAAGGHQLNNDLAIVANDIASIR